MRFGGCLSLIALLISAIHDLPALAAERPFLLLNVRMTEVNVLSSAARVALREEAESIWKEGHIRLRWIRRDAEADGGALLRVLVIPRATEVSTTPSSPRATASETSPTLATWPVGELLRRDDGDPIAIASITGARRILDQTRFQLLDHPTVHDRRLGVVLGRALAHEIGHFLLQTNTHATRGLMRAQIDATEFADMRSGTFRLDEAARVHLARMAERGSLSRDASTFSYSPQ
jgi:hypothetical protein